MLSQTCACCHAPATSVRWSRTAPRSSRNARLKARALCAATGTAAVADDTGLFVDALDGAPGVYSARYAGEDATYADNCRKLLDALHGVAADRRTARFATVALVAWPDGSETWAEGSVEGVITVAARGTQGFGYDPLFAPVETGGAAGPTFAEMDVDAKHAISHRGRALRGLADALSRIGPAGA